jgi:hypothetical protein
LRWNLLLSFVKKILGWRWFRTRSLNSARLRRCVSCIDTWWLCGLVSVIFIPQIIVWTLLVEILSSTILMLVICAIFRSLWKMNLLLLILPWIPVWSIIFSRTNRTCSCLTFFNVFCIILCLVQDRIIFVVRLRVVFLIKTFWLGWAVSWKLNWSSRI